MFTEVLKNKMETVQGPKTTDLLITSASLVTSWSKGRSPCRCVPVKLSALNPHLVDFLVLLVVVLVVFMLMLTVWPSL